MLGVTGGIAAYKSVQLARDLTRLGGVVDVVLTQGAQQFVTPLSFEGVTGRPALTDLFSADGAALHVRLGREADVVCVAPATADFLARVVQGRADDLLCTTLLATRAPVVVCPAMNDRMFAHPQVQENLAHVRERLGYEIAGPAEGALAAGEAEGPGRMLEPFDIEERIGRALGSEPTFAGRLVLVTAGPTREAVDPVRYVGNRSSGRMGYAIAQAAWRRGARGHPRVGSLEPRPSRGRRAGLRGERPGHVRRGHAPRSGRPTFPSSPPRWPTTVRSTRPAEKVKRGVAGKDLVIHLAENPDIAKDTGIRAQAGERGGRLRARDLQRSGERAQEARRRRASIPGGERRHRGGRRIRGRPRTGSPSSPYGRDPEALPLMSKDDVAEDILDRVSRLLGPEE